MALRADVPLRIYSLTLFPSVRQSYFSSEINFSFSFYIVLV